MIIIIIILILTITELDYCVARLHYGHTTGDLLRARLGGGGFSQGRRSVRSGQTEVCRDQLFFRSSKDRLNYRRDLTLHISREFNVFVKFCGLFRQI